MLCSGSSSFLSLDAPNRLILLLFRGGRDDGSDDTVAVASTAAAEVAGRVVAGKVEGRGVVGGMGGGGVVKGSVAIEVTSSLRFT